MLSGKVKRISNISIITPVIIEIFTLSLVKNGVTFGYVDLRLIFKMAALCFVNVSEEEINIMKEIPNMQHS